MRILVAEDDAKLLKSLVHVFESNNYLVDGVSNKELLLLARFPTIRISFLQTSQREILILNRVIS